MEEWRKGGDDAHAVREAVRGQHPLDLFFVRHAPPHCCTAAPPHCRSRQVVAGNRQPSQATAAAAAASAAAPEASGHHTPCTQSSDSGTKTFIGTKNNAVVVVTVKDHRANVSMGPTPLAPALAPRAKPRQHHEVRGSIEILNQPSVPPQDSARQPPAGVGLELEGDGVAAGKPPSELEWIEAVAAERLAKAGATVPGGAGVAAIAAASADLQLCVRVAPLVRELSVAVATPVPEINACVEGLILHGLPGQVVGVLEACLKTRTPPRNHVDRILMAVRYPKLQPWQHQAIHEAPCAQPTSAHHAHALAT